MATDKLRMMHSRFKGTDSDRLRQRSLIAKKKGTHRLTVVPFVLRCCSELVAVIVRLEGPLNRNPYVVGLLFTQGGEIDADLLQVQPGDHLVEFFG